MFKKLLNKVKSSQESNNENKELIDSTTFKNKIYTPVQIINNCHRLKTIEKIVEFLKE